MGLHPFLGPSLGDRQINKPSDCVVMNTMPGDIQVPWDPVRGALRLNGGAHESFLQELSDESWPIKRESMC